MNNLKQIKFLCRVARRAHYNDLGELLFSNRQLFERAAAHWRRRHPNE